MKTWLKATLGMLGLAGVGLVLVPADQTPLARTRVEIRELRAKIPRLEEAVRADGLSLYQAKGGRNDHVQQSPPSVVERWQEVLDEDHRRLKAAQEALADALVRLREQEMQIVPHYDGRDEG